MADSIEGTRQEIAATRARLDDTIAALGETMHSRVDAVKSKVDVRSVISDHPWLAIGAALAAGLAFGASGADRTAARATVKGAKKAGAATVAGGRAAVGAVKERFAGDGMQGETGMSALSEPETPSRSATGRLMDSVRDHFDQRAAEMALLLWDGAREMKLPTAEGGTWDPAARADSRQDVLNFASTEPQATAGAGTSRTSTGHAGSLTGESRDAADNTVSASAMAEEMPRFDTRGRGIE